MRYATIAEVLHVCKINNNTIQQKTMSDEVEMREQDTALLANSEDVLNGNRVRKHIPYWR